MAAAPDTGRYLSIDVLRGLAIVLMVQVHFVENLSPRLGTSWWLYDVSVILGSWPAPFFTFLSGLSYCLWLRKQEEQRRRDADITRITLRRGVFLFVVGLLFNFFVWLPEDTFNWDVLTLIGTSLLVLAYARKLPAPVLALVCVLIVLLSPPLRVVGDFSAYWEDDAYTYDFTFRDVFFGYFSNGYFPVFPWLLFPLAGFLSGDVVFHPRPSTQTRRWLIGLGVGLLALAGLCLTVGAWLPAQVASQYASGITEFPASTEYVLAMLGFILLSLLLLHRWLDGFSVGQVSNLPLNCKSSVQLVQGDTTPGPRLDGLKTRPTKALRLLQRFSTFSLTVYVLHHMVILWPLWLYGLWLGHDDPTVYWRRAVSTPVALSLAVAFLVACHFLLVLLERHSGYSLEAWMRRLCDGPPFHHTVTSHNNANSSRPDHTESEPHRWTKNST